MTEDYVPTNSKTVKMRVFEFRFDLVPAGCPGKVVGPVQPLARRKSVPNNVFECPANRLQLSGRKLPVARRVVGERQDRPGLSWLVCRPSVPAPGKLSTMVPTRECSLL